jgi:hypothetical protein
MKPGLKEPGFLRYNFGFRQALKQRSTSRKNAGIAQLVERNLAKVEVAGSNPVSRSKFKRSVIRDLRFFAFFSPQTFSKSFRLAPSSLDRR